ncbi:saccharopine dehydrogenase family protein [Flavitalea flava]
MQTNSFLLYGSNGYTGELIARHAHLYHLQPILAGRREEALAPLAARLNLPYKIFDLSDTRTVVSALKEVKLVMHAAGPFDRTARQMAEACLQTGTHYLDVNGDIGVFEMLKDFDTLARQAGIMILPGTGFDVVPTDCLALLLKKLLPDAIELKLAFAILGGSLSHGTAATMVSKLGEEGAMRKQGKIISSPVGEKSLLVDFGPKKLFTMTIPWGDISTAHFTTGIPDIETYSAIPPAVYRLMKGQSLFNWLLRTSLFRRIIKNKIDSRPAGPGDDKRSKATAFVWGQVKNLAGETATARLSGPEGYTLTTHSSLLIIQKILAGQFLPGYQTPASAFGEDLILEVPGVKREILGPKGWGVLGLGGLVKK